MAKKKEDQEKVPFDGESGEVSKPAQEVVAENTPAKKGAVKKPAAKSKPITEGEAKTITPELMNHFQDLQKQISELKDQLSASKSDEEEDDYDVDVFDDYLEDPVTFFAFSAVYSIYGDKRRGKESLPPSGEGVKFTKLYRYSKGGNTGRNVQMVSLSQAVVRSRSTAEWLRNHTLFGIKFFENIKKASGVDVSLAEKMAEANNLVSGLGDHAVIQRAKLEGVDLSNPDLSLIRKQLTEKLAENYLAKSKNKALKSLTGERDEKGRLLEHGKVRDVDADVRTDGPY